MPPDAMTGVAVGAGDRPVELQVGSAERAVLPHVGDHVPGAADVVEEGQGLPQVTTGAGPATRRELVPGGPVGIVDAADVEADGDPATVHRDRTGAPRRVVQRRGGEDDTCAVRRHRPLERVVVTDAAGQLDRDVQVPDHRREQLRVGTATERGVEIDQVDPFRPVLLPRECRRTCVAVVGGLRAAVALEQSHGSSGGDVDRRQEHEGHGRTVPRHRSSAAIVSVDRPARRGAPRGGATS